MILHTDEATHAVYHYSCVLYLSSQARLKYSGIYWYNGTRYEVQGTIYTAKVLSIASQHSSLLLLPAGRAL